MRYVIWKSFQWRQNVYSAIMTITFEPQLAVALFARLNLTKIRIESSALDFSFKYPSTYFPLLVFRTGSRDSGVAAVGRQPGGELHTLSLLSQ